ncbi:hypothetical protein NP233_g9344 [Leucocoprinus birnbaumii]|uniref:Xylanolytic transcriptional activator regulatory domain-containing protein n=1 Tax=Leucocoprinus birnbaumii TaxID=56174 RepID=A0AAD5YMB0_9AGAR|nr:hypothetical protein NP233_g9344 [Leucocoprinus birnbaumii]
MSFYRDAMATAHTVAHVPSTSGFMSASTMTTGKRAELNSSAKKSLLSKGRSQSSNQAHKEIYHQPSSMTVHLLNPRRIPPPVPLFAGQSPEAFDWPVTEVQGLEPSSLDWPVSIASNNWATGRAFQSSDSDLFHLRQTTPVSTVTISPETQQHLLNVFIEHRAQCHFYSNMTRFQVPLLQELEEQPHPALLQAINLLGCYFSRDPQLRSLESDLLKQSLHEITVSLRDCNHLCDVVQASSLLALYCYFNGRFVEGYRHAFVAARLAVGVLSLHQIPWPCPEYYHSYETYYDCIAAFWQVYMVDRAWSGVHGILAALSEDEYRGQITTPMMWTSDPLQVMLQDPMMIPSHLYQLLDPNDLIPPCMDSMALPAQKALASAIFDRTFHPVTDCENDKDPITHPSVIVAMQKIQSILPQFVGREIWSPQAPHVDVELLLVHTMLKVVELRLSEGEMHRVDGDAKMLFAVDWLTRSIDQLAEDDYAFLDPLIAGVWNEGAKFLIRKARYMKGLVASTSTLALSPGMRGMPSAVAFVDHCVDVLFRGLRSLSTYTRVAADYIESLEQEYLPHGRTIALDHSAATVFPQ